MTVETRRPAFREPITSAAGLRELVGEPGEFAVRKQLPGLDQHARSFIARSPFLLLGTANAAGRCDVSPRGDAPGFVLTLDAKRLVIPERPGNRRTDSLLNVLENPNVGLLFLVPGMEETLRVNGRACLTRDEELLERTAVQGKRPLLAIGVEVEEVFFHCAKAFKRARLWEPGSWPDRTELPTLGRILHDQLELFDHTVDKLDRRLAESYRRLY
jgi:PPOX class probable FMN-dependent enzyme